MEYPCLTPRRPAAGRGRAARGRSPPRHCIVLVKQVPDVSNIPEDAWDRDKGTLRRACWKASSIRSTSTP